MMPIQHPTLLTYASMIKKCGYDNHSTAEDVSMFFKLLQYGSFGNVDKVLFKYRVRLSSNSFRDPKKTFYLTLRSRIKAILELDYRPDMGGILISLIQLLLMAVLPSKVILSLYELLRFKRLPSLRAFGRKLALVWQ